MLQDNKSKKSKKNNTTKRPTIGTTIGQRRMATGNEKIINVLETVKSYYARLHDKIHVAAYERAIYQIKKWPHPITKGSQVAHLEGIGKGMVQKIDTILATGSLPIIKEKSLTLMQNKRTRKSAPSGVHPISQVLGFSSTSAGELERKFGIRTVADLQDFVKKNPQFKTTLTKIQEMGLRYHDDLQKKVPRAEITQIGARIEDILQDSGVMVFLAGSYPSGLKTESKDIDILLVARDSKMKNKSYLADLVQVIRKGIPLETITLGANKFLGLVRLSGTDNATRRHLDIRLVSIREFPYAWLYFASGVVFNKLIRERLKKRGYKLNEWGLFKYDKRLSLSGKNENENSTNSLGKITDKEELLEYAENIEKKIFKIAGLEYKTIKERY